MKKTSQFYITLCHSALLVADALFQYGGGSGQIHYARFECSGDEEELANCSVAQNSSIEEITVCSHADDAAVICTNGMIAKYNNVVDEGAVDH